MIQPRDAGGHAAGASTASVRCWPGRGVAHEVGADALAIKAAGAALPVLEGEVALSASGSVSSSRRPFASSYLTTSGCGTTSAGRCLTANGARGAWALKSQDYRAPRPSGGRTKQVTYRWSTRVSAGRHPSLRCRTVLPSGQRAGITTARPRSSSAGGDPVILLYGLTTSSSTRSPTAGSRSERSRPDRGRFAGPCYREERHTGTARRPAG